VTDQSRPVVLVHGWKSHPGIWDRLVEGLDNRSICSWTFDHSRIRGAGVESLATLLQEFIWDQRAETGYFGPVDMVCHSMGTGIARYLLEVLDKDARREKVRLLIGLGPPNNGSSLAELFFDPVHSPRILQSLGGIFVPRRFNPADDIIVRQFRPGSDTMAALHAAGIRDDIRYRFILTGNCNADPEFFSPFHGKTWVKTGNGWETTYAGDGIVPHADSWLQGAGFDIFPLDPASLSQSPDLYCHLHLPKNPEVIERLHEYLSDPKTPPGAGCPECLAMYRKISR
jgi:pimeloyl-ACP methyl ester carboxylesterase